MLTDEQINDIARQKKAIRDEERSIKTLIELAETNPDEFEELQPICDFLNLFEIKVGEC
jgi:hypothetical protein